MTRPRQDINHQTPEKWLYGETQSVRRELLVTIGLAFAAGVLIVLQARLLSLACQRIVMEHALLSAILPLAGSVAVVAIIRALLLFLSERRSVRAAAEIKRRIRSLLYRKIQKLGPTGMIGEDTGPLLEATTTAIESIEPYISRFLPQVALAGLLPLVTLIFVVPAEWRSGLVLLFSAPFIPLFMILIGRGSEKLHRRQWTKLSRMSGQLLDLVQGLPDLKIFGAVKREAAAVENISDQYRHATINVLRVAFLSAFTLEFFASIGTAVVAVFIGFRLLDGNLTLADGLFVLLLAPEFYLPLRTLGLSYHSRMQGVAAAERIAPLLQLPDPQGYDGNLPAPTTASSIKLENVSFSYGANRGGIKEINLELSAGSLIALVGESGSGKTTLARMITGLARPESGRITVNGVDLNQLSPEAWRNSLAWVPQQPFFFKGSIRDNLLLGIPVASDEEIHSALEVAAATEFISRLSAGLNTEMGDRGAGLSGGELRRLALARAFLRKAVLIILDEPTAGLDAANEQLVIEAIRKMARTSTILLISHREDTVAMADRIAILVDGRLDWIVSPGEYRALAAGVA